MRNPIFSLWNDGLRLFFTVLKVKGNLNATTHSSTQSTCFQLCGNSSVSFAWLWCIYCFWVVLPPTTPPTLTQDKEYSREEKQDKFPRSSPSLHLTHLLSRSAHSLTHQSCMHKGALRPQHDLSPLQLCLSLNTDISVIPTHTHTQTELCWYALLWPEILNKNLIQTHCNSGFKWGSLIIQYLV